MQMLKYLSWKSRGKDGGKGFVLTWKPKKQMDRWTWAQNIKYSSTKAGLVAGGLSISDSSAFQDAFRI